MKESKVNSSFSICKLELQGYYCRQLPISNRQQVTVLDAECPRQHHVFDLRLRFEQRTRHQLHSWAREQEEVSRLQRRLELFMVPDFQQLSLSARAIAR